MKFIIRPTANRPVIELVPETVEEMQTLGVFAQKGTTFQIIEYKGYRDVRTFNMAVVK